MLARGGIGPPFRGDRAEGDELETGEFVPERAEVADRIIVRDQHLERGSARLFRQRRQAVPQLVATIHQRHDH
jgi:hypothetical protein